MSETIRGLKILFVSSDKYPTFRPAARAIFGEVLPTRGHRIDWLLQAEKNNNREHTIRAKEGCVYVGATCDGGSRWDRLIKHFLDLKNDCRMLGLARRNKYDLIQVKDKYISALLAILVAKALRIKLFYWLAFPHPEASIYNAQNGIARYRLFYFFRGFFWKILLYRIIMPAADHVFVQSEQMRQDIVKEGVPEDKMTPVPGSVNLDNIPYIPPNHRHLEMEQNAEVRIIYLGTLNRMRRLDFIIRTFGKVIEQIPSAKLFILGKGDQAQDESFLKSEVKRLGLDESVVFTGYLPMEEAWEYIRIANVCLSPYYPTPILRSTSPTKLIEYMAMGRPVVGNDHPEQKALIEESGAGYCVPWNEDAFANAIIKILTNPGIAEDMGLKGRQYVEEQRSNNVMADIVEREYFKACGMRRGSSASNVQQVK